MPVMVASVRGRMVWVVFGEVEKAEGLGGGPASS